MSEPIMLTVLFVPAENKVVTKDYGIVTGTSVMSRMELFDAWAKMKSWLGGKLGVYESATTKGLGAAALALVKSAREQDKSVNAILGLQISTFEVGEDAIGVVIYGSAVRLEDKEE